jgi:hypothetical protein
VENKSYLLGALKSKFTESQSLARAIEHLQPGNPVKTKFGDGWICAYRVEDDMLMATLGFCEPPAQIWMTVKCVIDEER